MIRNARWKWFIPVVVMALPVAAAQAVILDTVRGGSFYTAGGFLKASTPGWAEPMAESYDMGFRVAGAVPEPRSMTLLVSGLLAGWLGGGAGSSTLCAFSLSTASRKTGAWEGETIPCSPVLLLFRSFADPHGRTSRPWHPIRATPIHG